MESTINTSRVHAFLDRRGIDHTVVPHPPAFTAKQLAHDVGVRNEDLAKAVVLRVGDDEETVMAVLPASRRIDWGRLSAVLGVDEVRLASEAELLDLFPDCDLGAMPVLGNLYGVRVVVDEHLVDRPWIVFHSGDRSEAIGMSYLDFARAVRPTVANFSKH
jgi:Ala-tRNA(Pro) deacylase